MQSAHAVGMTFRLDQFFLIRPRDAHRRKISPLNLFPIPGTRDDSEIKSGLKSQLLCSRTDQFRVRSNLPADNVMGVDLVQQRDGGGDGNDNRKYREVKRSHSRGS
jgi:hypothetical protein